MNKKLFVNVHVESLETSKMSKKRSLAKSNKIINLQNLKKMQKFQNAIYKKDQISHNTQNTPKK